MATIYQKRTDNRTAQISVSDLVQEDRADVRPTNELIQEDPILSDSLFVPRRITQSESRVKKFPENLIEIMEYLEKLTIVDPNFQDEDSILNPSDYAVRQSFKFLMQLYNLLGDNFPRGFASLESRGGVNFIWENDDFSKEIRVKIAAEADLNSSIFYCDDNRDEHRLIKNPSPVDVAGILCWLSTDNPIT